MIKIGDMTHVTKKEYDALPDSDFHIARWEIKDNPAIVYKKNKNTGTLHHDKFGYPIVDREVSGELIYKANRQPANQQIWDKIKEHCKYPITTVSDDEMKGMLAAAQPIGVSDDEIKKMISGAGVPSKEESQVKRGRPSKDK